MAQSYNQIGPDELANIVREEGYIPKVEAGDTPKVVFKVEGIQTMIVMYGCSQGSCSSFQYYAAWRVDHDKKSAYLNAVNEWNRKKRFSRAYLDSEGDPALEMDVPLGGVKLEYLKTSFQRWARIAPEFSRTVVEGATGPS